jgi:hypothetical protein
VNWNELVKDRVQWQAFVEAVTNFCM